MIATKLYYTDVFSSQIAIGCILPPTHEFILSMFISDLSLDRSLFYLFVFFPILHPLVAIWENIHVSVYKSICDRFLYKFGTQPIAYSNLSKRNISEIILPCALQSMELIGLRLELLLLNCLTAGYKLRGSNSEWINIDGVDKYCSDKCL